MSNFCHAGELQFRVVDKALGGQVVKLLFEKAHGRSRTGHQAR